VNIQENMHIRITVSSSYHKYIYYSDIPEYYYIFGMFFKLTVRDGSFYLFSFIKALYIKLVKTSKNGRNISRYS